jgi:hypothetical protein
MKFVDSPYQFSNTNLKKIFRGIALWFFLLLSALSVLGVSLILYGYFVASKHLSYLPEIHQIDLKPHSTGLNKIELKNSIYILQAGENGSIVVKTTGGDTIMSNLSYYSSYMGTKEKWGMDNISEKRTSDSTVSISGEGPLGVLVSIILTVPDNKPRLDINIKTHYSINTVVRRESLVAGFNVSVSEVYRKNRQVDVGSFDSEYWLQRQGVRFGSGDRSALIYHTPFVSSLQLDVKKSLLFVNLEYYLDHPFINIPYQQDGGSKWVDLSMAKFPAGAERKNNFSIYFGDNSKSTPRFMLVPNGYLAGYVLTEHADGGNIRTNRAAYFGSEDISRASNAVGGFVGHKIPVTKSVFYADPDSAGYSSIRDDDNFPEFLDFLDQLNETGLYEICLHTPENLNSNREVLGEAIQFMKNRFDTKTWIDHGMYSGKINRETIVADGLNPDSKYYAADLWEKYDTRYFWSSGVEMIRNYSLKDKIKQLRLSGVSINLWKRYLSPEELNKISFYTAVREIVTRYRDKGELNSLLSYKSNALPTPLYWQNLTQTRNFYSWPTDYEKKYGKLSGGKVDIEQKLLNKLVSDWGVFISHDYFVRNSPDDGTLIDLKGKLVINPYFDKILGLMAQKRDEGDLYITTIRDLLDYWILIDKVSFDYMPNGVIYVNNGNQQRINGLSLVVNARTIMVNGDIPKFRKTGENTIFWFDIPANKRVSIQIEQ